MNDQATAKDTDKEPTDYPPMTVLPVEGDPARVYVLGEAGWWYEIHLGNESRGPSCECWDWRFRGHLRPCKHIEAAKAFRALGGAEQATEETTQWKQLTEAEKRAVFA